MDVSRLVVSLGLIATVGRYLHRMYLNLRRDPGEIASFMRTAFGSVTCAGDAG